MPISLLVQMNTLPLTPRRFSQRKQAQDLSLVAVSAPVHGGFQIQQSSCRMNNNLPVISSSSFHGKVSRPGQRRSPYQQVWAQAKEEMTCPGLLAKQQPNKAMPKPCPSPGDQVADRLFHNYIWPHFFPMRDLKMRNLFIFFFIAQNHSYYSETHFWALKKGRFQHS